MQTQDLISVNEFCRYHNIEISFISLLQQTGLIEITIVNKKWFIDTERLQQLEKIIHFYFDLDINLEGIETISYLLHRISAMQEEIIMLRNRLRLYENFE